MSSSLFTQWMEAAKPVLPFFAQIIVFWYLGQVFKKRIWTKARADRSKLHEFMRDTLPLHPIVAGVFWGALYPYLPAVEFVTTNGAAIVQGILAGAVSVAGFTALEHYADRKQIGWLLGMLRSSVPEQSIAPAPPKPPKAPPPLGRRPKI